MRISDWSSDVCSSDLKGSGVRAAPFRPRECSLLSRAASPGAGVRLVRKCRDRRRPALQPVGRNVEGRRLDRRRYRPRSEEHTSELQSLMRTPYAVFCLQKKNNENYNIHNDTIYHYISINN